MVVQAIESWGAPSLSQDYLGILWRKYSHDCELIWKTFSLVSLAFILTCYLLWILRSEMATFREGGQMLIRQSQTYERMLASFGKVHW